MTMRVRTKIGTLFSWPISSSTTNFIATQVLNKISGPQYGSANPIVLQDYNVLYYTAHYRQIIYKKDFVTIMATFGSHFDDFINYSTIVKVKVLYSLFLLVFMGHVAWNKPDLIWFDCISIVRNTNCQIPVSCLLPSWAVDENEI